MYFRNRFKSVFIFVKTKYDIAIWLGDNTFAVNSYTCCDNNYKQEVAV